MMCSLIHSLIAIFTFLIGQTGILKGMMLAHSTDNLTLIINLIEGHPILNLVFITLKASGCKAYKELNHATIPPAAVLFGKMQRNLKMRQGYHRLHAML